MGRWISQASSAGHAAEKNLASSGRHTQWSFMTRIPKKYGTMDLASWAHYSVESGKMAVRFFVYKVRNDFFFLISYYRKKIGFWFLKKWVIWEKSDYSSSITNRQFVLNLNRYSENEEYCLHCRKTRAFCVFYWISWMLTHVLIGVNFHSQDDLQVISPSYFC